MIPSEYDVGDAKDSHAVGTGIIEGERAVIISAWENGPEDMDNLSCIALPPKDAGSLARALLRAADGIPPDRPKGTMIVRYPSGVLAAGIRDKLLGKG
jgi:hypothetical protein